MTNHQLEIIMKLRDEVSKRLDGIQGNLVKFSNAMEKVGQTLASTGRMISKVGSLMATFGAVITGPLFLAFKSADKYSGQVHERLEKLKNLTLAFQVHIATALIPIMDRVINTLGVLWNAWNKLSPATQQAIIQGVAITGVLLTLGGVITILVGKFITLGGYILKLAQNIMLWAALNWPFALIAAAIGGLIVLTLKYQSVSTPVLNSIEVAAYAVAIGYEKILIAMMKVAHFTMWDKSGNAAIFLAGQIDAANQLIAKLESRISGVMVTGKGSLETGLEETKKQIGSLFDLLKNPPKFDNKPIAERLESLQEISHRIFTAMSSDMGDFFFNSIKNRSLKFVDFFQSLGNSILRIWTDALAKMLTKWLETMTTMSGNSGTNWLSIIGNVLGIFSGTSGVISGGVGGHTVNTGAQNVAGHSVTKAWSPYLSGGTVRALSGLNFGPAEIPVIAHSGERILSREENKQYSLGAGKGDFNFSPSFKIEAADAKSFVSHKKEITAMVNDAILKNSNIRRTMMAYTKR